MKNIKVILGELEKFGILEQGHSNSSLVNHLIGTYEVLKQWDCSNELCLAGLCHSVYGTESYKKQTVPLEYRNFVKELIGEYAEELTYFFGAHVKEHFWCLLERTENFEIKDRFTGLIVSVTENQISDLVTLTLANWLEQRLRADEKYHFIRQDEFLASERFLPEIAFKDFKTAYKLV